MLKDFVHSHFDATSEYDKHFFLMILGKDFVVTVYDASDGNMA